MFGYIPLGVSFGFIFAKSLGAWYLAPVMSLMVFAGAAQFIAVTLMAEHATLWQILLATFMVNLRHIFYGLSFLGQFPDRFFIKTYMIFGLTDESYSLLTTVNRYDSKLFDFLVIAISHSYWIIGSIIGALIGYRLSIDLMFLKFSLTCLFLVLAIEQTYAIKNPYPFVFAMMSGLTAMLFAKEMLITSLLLFLGFYLVNYFQNGVREYA